MNQQIDPTHDEAIDPVTGRVRPIRPRKMNFPFGTHIPRAWFGGSMASTRAVNAVNLLFPAGERFFVRSVRHFREAASGKPGLWDQIKGFAAQEVRHGIEHERFFATLEAQGYKLQGFLEFYEQRFFPWAESRVPANLRLAATVALEHYTATLGDFALRESFFESADPDVRALLEWHAAEEIEHKAVAFDLLSEVDPRLRTRWLGWVIATAGLFGWWSVAIVLLMSQERAMEASEDAAIESAADEASGLLAFLRQQREFAQIIVESLDFLRRDFHPDDVDNYHLAEDYLASVGAA